MSFSATLVYAVDVGIQLAASYTGRVAAVNLYGNDASGNGVLTLLGFDLVSDNTFVSGLAVTRRIVVKTNVQGDRMYLTKAAVKDVLRNIFAASLCLGTPALVAAGDPIVV